MVYPPWLGNLTQRDESLRRHHGLFPAKDGWYKTINIKKRYIARPMPLADVVALLPARIAEITGTTEERPARIAVGSTTIEQLTEIFTSHLWQRHTTGQPRKLSRRTYDDYCTTLSLFVEIVGRNEPAVMVGPAWFTRFARSVAKRAATTRRRHIIYLTSFFNWAGPGRHSLNFYKTPVNFGPDFIKPGDDQLRDEIDGVEVLYTPEAFRDAMTQVVDCPLLYVAGLMGLNCGYLPGDLVAAPESSFDLDGAICRFPRTKNNIERLNPLMPETVAAIRAYLKTRPAPRDKDQDLLLLNEWGEPFCQRRHNDPARVGNHGNTVGAYWRQVTGRPFKGLRTTLATEADGAKDDRAIDLIMGHAASTVRQKNYVKQFDPARCRAVLDSFWPRFVAQLPPLSGALRRPSELVRERLEAAERAATPQPTRDRSGTSAPLTRHATRSSRPVRRAG